MDGDKSKKIVVNSYTGDGSTQYKILVPSFNGKLILIKLHDKKCIFITNFHIFNVKLSLNHVFELIKN